MAAQQQDPDLVRLRAARVCPCRREWPSHINQIVEAWRQNVEPQDQDLKLAVKKAILVRLMATHSMSMSLADNSTVVVAWISDSLKRYSNYKVPQSWNLEIRFQTMEGFSMGQKIDTISFTRHPVVTR